ncbi:MAG: hypothetical protein M1479_03230 [Actinobacteria bacterium]|nr:hypothetical protein [Actinomycetota bacterium]
MILITPFIDNENNLIEIGIFFKEPEKIIISDLGKIKSYLRQLVINLISNPKISDVKNFIKISYADFLDLKSFKNSFCIIFDDKKYPYVWHELKKTNFINILIRKKINFFGYYQDFISIKSYLLK